MRVLVVNAGSSTLKFRIVDAHDDIVTGHDVDPWDGEGSTVDLHRFLADRPPVDAVGHRVVHGGTRLRKATHVTAAGEERESVGQGKRVSVGGDLGGSRI